MNRSLLLLTFLNALNYLDRMIFAAVAPQVQADLNLTNQQIGILMSAFIGGYICFSPLFGYLGDRTHRPKLMAVGLVAFSAATFSTAFATEFWSLLLSRILVGIGEASFVIIAPAYIADSASNEYEANKRLAIFYSAMPVGTALGLIFGGHITSLLGWESVFIFAAVPGFMLFFPTMRLDEKRPSHGRWIAPFEFFDNFFSLIKARQYRRI